MNVTDLEEFYGKMFVLTNMDIFKRLRDLSLEVDFTDALSWGQLKSKRWLVDELLKLDLELGKVFLCAGWYGILANMIDAAGINYNKIRSFDIDPECSRIADIINKDLVKQRWKFKASTFNILNMEWPLTEHHTLMDDGTFDIIKEKPNTIINTSCEHIDTKDFIEWYNNIRPGTIVIMQNNDYFDLPEHVNCVNSLQHFKNLTPMQKCLYAGKLELHNYNRFMRIGIK